VATVIPEFPDYRFEGWQRITRALPLAAPTREMHGDVGGNLDRRRQDLHYPAVYLLLL
jgi:hypothetical protein